MASNPNGTVPSDLTSAAMWGDKELLESLLMNGADPDFPNQQGNSPLHEAAYYGELECASILLDHKANVNISGPGEKTPLHKAVVGVRMLEPGNKFASEEKIKENQCDIIKVLVAHGALLWAVDSSGATAKDVAYENDFFEGVDLLDELEGIIEIETKKRQKVQSLKDLYQSCEKGDLRGVQAQLHTMPDAINEFIQDGQNLLMCASDKGYLDLVEYLLDNRAVAVASPVTNLTALHLACRKGHTDVVIALLNRLPALLAIDDSPKGTSLHIAAREGHVEIVKNLLAVAARSVQLKSLERLNSDAGKSDVSLYGSGNERVQKNLELLDSLGEVTVDIMAPTVRDKQTPLHEAAAGGHVQVVRLIVDFMREYYSGGGGGGGGGGGRKRSGAGLSPRPPERDPTAVSPAKLDHSPRVPGRGAAQGKKTKAVPGIDLMTLRGKTAFHEAAHEGHFDVMMVLLEAGADINSYMRVSLDMTANPELTALVQACLMNRADIVRFLLKNGATDARLKALVRTLRMKYDDIAGLLLCYNGGVEPVTDVSHSKAAREAASAKLTLLSALWNSKQLHYVRKGWFQTVCREFPVPESQTAVISQVDISSNNLVDLPLALFQLTHLTQLDVSRNKITELPLVPEEDDPQHGWACPKLSVLDVSSNQLTSLPSALFRLRELKDLNANSNLITEVPECVWTAPKLCKLYLNKNKLEIFPASSSLSNHSPHVKIPSAASVTVSGEGGRESGYQSGLPVSLNPSSAPLLPDSPRLASSGGAKSMSDSQGTFEDSMIMGRSMWSRRRKSAGLGSILSSKGSRRRATFGRDVRRNSIGSATQQSSFISWRFKNFQDTAFEVEDLDDLDPDDSEEGSETFPLEHLDLSYNQLTSIPQGLSCLAPKLQKLNLSRNLIRNLGVLGDYPPDLELLDASSNELCAAIMEPAMHIFVSCARKALLGMSSSMLIESVAPPNKSCSHRLHKNLRKLSTVRLSHNQLVDVQLFRIVNRNRSGDLTASIEESVSVAAKQRTNTMGDPFAVRVSPGPSGRKELLSKSVSTPAREMGSPNPRQSVHRAGSGDSPKVGRNVQNGSNSSNSGGSQEEATVQSPSSVILSPLYPMLSTLELGHNKLHNVPNSLHLVSTLACLIISHNPIETLPLELSNLDHLWNLEYEGCNLVSPPKQDLDKYRLAADKLLYMKSLLHDAKPNESLKLMLVGLQRMGKTTLLSRLREVNEAHMVASTFNERVRGEEGRAATTGSSKSRRKEGTLSTVGVDVGIWRYRKDLEPDLRGKRRSLKAMKSVTFYTWDFGGQEEYYVTHQCFLSTRSLYLAVWDVEEGEAGIDGLGPWLHNIQARAPGSPVIIVGTHIDRLKGEDRERKKVEFSNIIKDKYLVGRGPQQQRELGLPKIRDVMYVGCPATGRDDGVVDLRKALYDIAFTLTLPKVAGHSAGSKMKLLEQPIPASFLKLEEQVRIIATALKQSSEPPVLREDKFREETSDIICNPRELDQAVTFLHENGVMLHYATPALSHLYFVDPQWLCDMLAHVVTVPEVNSFIPRRDGPDAGILRTSVLAHVFRGKLFPQAHRQEYIELLGKFEVALILDRHRLLVPSMLPLRPRYTIHAFRSVFPRPSIRQILDQYPNISKLFSPPKSRTVSGAGHAARDPLGHSPQLGSPSEVAERDVATHISEELFRTGLMLRRFYFMTYVPSGFWPRLISRFLTCSTFVSIVLRALGYSEDVIKEKVSEVANGESSRALGLEWAYWKTGIELWYKGLSLLRVSEILPESAFQHCEPSPSIFEQSRTVPIEPFQAVEDLSFELNRQWMPVHMTPNHGIEILVPDTVCPALLKNELEAAREGARVGEGYEDPHHETVWMSAGLLTQAVDFIDTLLEDWYPGLGAREGNTTVESIPYVNRVIPCPFCVSGACVTEPEGQVIREASPPTPPFSPTGPRKHSPAPSSSVSVTPPKHRHFFKRDSSPPEAPNFPSPPKQPQDPTNSNHEVSGSRPHRSRAINISLSLASHSVKPHSVKRPLFHTPPLSRAHKSNTPSNISALLSPHQERKVLELQRRRSLSSPLSNAVALPMAPPGLPHRPDRVLRNKSHDDLTNTSTLQISGPERLAQPLPEEKGLVQASKFGFMIESCIMSARNSEDMVCPAHKTHPLPIRDIAPDVMFADLPIHFLLDPACVDRGQYVDHGTFGDIYHGTVYPTPTSTDDEGRDVALKIDRLDSKKCTPDTATKSYIEVRAEVSLLHKLRHPHVIDFIGVVLQPLCFILEWACGGSLHSALTKYRKVDARVGPHALQQVALQVARGLSYLHQFKVVYYDLKSPNVLVFQFPTPQESLQQTTQQCSSEGGTVVYVKIADLGISRIMSPGGTMGFKGSPGFMAPEILKYVGMEAVTEKVDMFSFGMFMYEVISLHFPFEKQNLMSSQIEKLVIDGERPPLQSRELSSPILYLDVMRWCWQQDFRARPSADQLIEVLSNESVPRLVEAIRLHSTASVTCSALCIFPIEQSAPEDQSVLEYSAMSVVPVSPSTHPYVARGDLQEDVWLGLYSKDVGGRGVGGGRGRGRGGDEGSGEGQSQVCVINFKGKANFFSESFPVCNARITSMCCVVDTMWVGTEEGQVFLYDALTRNYLLDRHLALLPEQAITSITHLLTLRQVLVTRSDGCLLLFDEVTQEHKLPDAGNYDNRVNGTQLPVRSVFKTIEKLPIFKALVVGGASEDKKVVWCATRFEMLLLVDVYASRIEYCRKCYNRPRNDLTPDDHVADLALMIRGEEQLVWALTQPHNCVHCWSTSTEKLLMTVDCSVYSPSPVTCICALGDKLQLAQASGQILLLSTPENEVDSAVRLHGHMKTVHSMLTLGARVLPKHWRPSILGRSNVMDYLLDLLGEDDIQDIHASMVGRQTRLLVSVGTGFYGIAGKVVETLMSPRDITDNFLLLWSL